MSSATDTCHTSANGFSLQFLREERLILLGLEYRGLYLEQERSTNSHETESKTPVGSDGLVDRLTWQENLKTVATLLTSGLYSKLNSITTTARYECQLNLLLQSERREDALKESLWAQIEQQKS